MKPTGNVIDKTTGNMWSKITKLSQCEIYKIDENHYRVFHFTAESDEPKLYGYGSFNKNGDFVIN